MKLTRRRAMEPLAATVRTANVERLAREQLYVLVIGDGITGAGVALDAAARGYSVALVEKADSASGTSSKSTKLAHGGIRYLPQFDFAMIHEGVVERGLMVRHAPFLVRPQAFVIPVYAQMRWPRSLPVRPPTDVGLVFVLDIGLWMYDLMAGRLNIGRHKRISARETLRRAPKLRSQGLKKALLYYDAQTNDAQLTVIVLRTAGKFGAVVTHSAQVNDYLEVNLTEEDILSVYAGYRTLVKSRGARAADLSRTHAVLQENNGMVTIVGGKLTTYRRMAQDTVDVLAKRDGMPTSHPTKHLLLAGAIGWRDAKREIEARGRRIGLPQDMVEHLACNFGSLTSTILDLIGEDASLGERLLPELPYVRAEVVYACRGEMAMKLEDVLARRTRIMLEDAERGAGIAPEVAALMAPELGWSSDYTQAQVEQYRVLVDHQLEAEGLRR